MSPRLCPAIKVRDIYIFCTPLLQTQIPIFAIQRNVTREGTFFLIMIVKVLALCLVMEICLGMPVEDTRPTVPVPPAYASGMPVKPVNPPNADLTDLKTDPSTWWYTSWYNSYPTYYDYYHPRPTYTVWHPYYY